MAITVSGLKVLVFATSVLIASLLCNWLVFETLIILPFAAVIFLIGYLMIVSAASEGGESHSNMVRYSAIFFFIAMLLIVGGLVVLIYNYLDAVEQIDDSILKREEAKDVFQVLMLSLMAIGVGFIFWIISQGLALWKLGNIPGKGMLIAAVVIMGVIAGLCLLTLWGAYEKYEVRMINAERGDDIEDIHSDLINEVREYRYFTLAGEIVLAIAYSIPIYLFNRDKLSFRVKKQAFDPVTRRRYEYYAEE